MSDYKLRISAKGLFFNQKGEVLLVKGKDTSLGEFWAAPGGGVEEGEGIAEAAEREVIEETGYTGKADHLIYMQDFDCGTRGRQLELFFSGMVDESVPVRAEEADHEARFFSREELEQVTFRPTALNPFEPGGAIQFGTRK